jgi:hypothetical protein
MIFGLYKDSHQKWTDYKVTSRPIDMINLMNNKIIIFKYFIVDLEIIKCCLINL